ncbi:hypothetical protein SAMN05421509_102251 [Chromohalobacter canadensis]|uniref:Uncharacterized protein n=1 Tax=Chromohalobacter canadensis TaxID=141389 RepID=A0A285VGN5_9GAMM|nr:hypothetical protein SAMN05421509_102251 [Chromohalobacter canadensis]
MLSSDCSEENITDFQDNGFLCAALSIVHFYLTIKNDKHLFTIIDVPLVRLVCPM